MIRTNAQLEAQQAAQAAPVAHAPLHGLVGYLLTLWEQAKQAKRRVEEQILRNMRQVNGQYEPDKIAAIRQMGGSEIYYLLTLTKCRAAKAWATDILRPAGDRPWSLDPTPIPEMPPEVEEEIRQNLKEQMIQNAMMMGTETGDPVDPMEIVAMIEAKTEEIKDLVKKALKEAAKKALAGMADKIADQLAEGGWNKAFDAVINDIIRFPAGIMCGPIVRRRKVKSWVAGPTGWRYEAAEKLVLEFERVHPLDMYPEGDSTGPNDGWCFRRHRMSRKDIVSLIGVPGYDEKAIRAVLDELGRGGLREWLVPDLERAEQENRESMSVYSSTKIQALEFWGSAQGSLLLEHGIDPKYVPDPVMEYEINAWLIGGHVIKAIINPDQTGVKPFSVTSFEKVDGSWWGRGIPELMADSQDGINAASRALLNNVGLASGPMVEVNKRKLVPGENGQTIWPWRTFQTDDGGIPDSQPAIHFFQPELIAHELIEVSEKFERQADEETGVPRYAHGDPNVEGAGGTASGLSMLMTASARGIKDFIGSVDMDIISTTIERVYEFDMRFDPDQSIKGDAKVVARGVSSLMAKEQRTIRINETLEAMNNDADLAITGLEGRKELWKEAIKSLDVEVDKVIPNGPGIQQYGLPMPTEPGQGGDKKKPKTLNPAGQPAGGTDTRLVPAGAGK